MTLSNRGSMATMYRVTFLIGAAAAGLWQLNFFPLPLSDVWVYAGLYSLLVLVGAPLLGAGKKTVILILAGIPLSWVFAVMGVIAGLFVGHLIPLIGGLFQAVFLCGWTFLLGLLLQAAAGRPRTES